MAAAVEETANSSLWMRRGDALLLALERRRRDAEFKPVAPGVGVVGLLVLSTEEELWVATMPGASDGSAVWAWWVLFLVAVKKS